jgi:2-polyprenyl-3-methyl-5-hydroxy-6-metoxy-1,4-benzoquinol methylase
MRNVRAIEVRTDADRFLRAFDLHEIDADPPTLWKRKLDARMALVERAVARHAPTGGLVVDAGCAQGNFAIRLAERGYRVTGLDIRRGFLRYARKKEDRTHVRWAAADATRLPLADACADVVLLGEILEHVAEPAVLAAQALRAVKPGGALVATTPNGRCFRIGPTLPSYSKVSADLEALKARQFGPSAEDHLFALRPDELRNLAPPGHAVELTFASSGFWARPTNFLARSDAASRLIESASALPIWARFLCETSVLVVEKPR